MKAKDWHPREASFAQRQHNALRSIERHGSKDGGSSRQRHSTLPLCTKFSPSCLFAAPRRVGTMVDAFRAQLDALMGVDRNGDRVRVRRRTPQARAFG
jgi:hypothetical protein